MLWYFHILIVFDYSDEFSVLKTIETKVCRCRNKMKKRIKKTLCKMYYYNFNFKQKNRYMNRVILNNIFT